MVKAERVLELLRALVRIDSLTNTEKERDIEAFLLNCLASMTGVQAGRIPLTDDPARRAVIYGLVTGKTKDIVIFMNHHDAVGLEPYGNGRETALVPEQAVEFLLQIEQDPEVLHDLRSGQWLAGRGTCDMKGGIAAQLAVLEAYAAHPGNAGILFLSVPDEESFSAGMRSALPFLLKLQQDNALHYRLLVDCEPNQMDAGRLVAYTGSVGKMLPVVVVQGKSVHIGDYGSGINPLGVLAHIVDATEGKRALQEKCGAEWTPPPTWLYMRDRKEKYDVSLPQRAAAYANFLMFRRTPADIFQMLTRIAAEGAARYSEFSERTPAVTILTYGDLLAKACQCPGFDSFYKALQDEIGCQLQAGSLEFPGATIQMVERVLDFSALLDPVVVLALAPPYYPAVSSVDLAGGIPAGVLETIGQCQPVRFDRYFTGISDCSYCGVGNDMAMEDYMPLWGKNYSFDAAVLRQLHIPFLLLGPWGKDLHDRTERVHVPSLTVTLPHTLECIVDCIGSHADSPA